MRGDSSGQATVELALTLPLIAVLLAVIVEVGGLALDSVRLWHATREAVRIASVDRDPEHTKAAAQRAGLEGLSVEIAPEPTARRRGEPVGVTITYHPRGSVPLIGE